MSKSKCSGELYISFLEVTSSRYSALSLSEVDPESMDISHDSVMRWLASQSTTERFMGSSGKRESGKSGDNSI